MRGIVETRSLGLAVARIAIDRAIEESVRLGCVTCIAVVDRAGHLVTFDRMDEAPALSVQLAQDKAYTVVINGMASHEWWESIKDEPSLVHGINKIDRLIIFGGGLPIIRDGELIGAIGVSGKSSMEQDRAIAQAGVDAAVRWLDENSER
jgi:glc operon protein GlcG